MMTKLSHRYKLNTHTKLIGKFFLRAGEITEFEYIHGKIIVEQYENQY